VSPTVVSATKVAATTSIIHDAWLYNYNAGAGGISATIKSDLIQSLRVPSQGNGLLIKTGKSQFYEQENPYSFTTTNELYLGSGDYSTLLGGDGYNNLTITPGADGSYEIEYAKFGYANATLTPGQGYVPTEGYFASIGYTNQSQSALVALDFIGLGLPDYLWWQVVNMMRQANSVFAEDMTCDAQVGGICYLNELCNYY